MGEHGSLSQVRETICTSKELTWIETTCIETTGNPPAGGAENRRRVIRVLLQQEAEPLAMLQQEETRKYRSRPLECYEIFTINLCTLTSSSTPVVDHTTGRRHMQ